VFYIGISGSPPHDLHILYCRSIINTPSRSHTRSCKIQSLPQYNYCSAVLCLNCLLNLCFTMWLFSVKLLQPALFYRVLPLSVSEHTASPKYNVISMYISCDVHVFVVQRMCKEYNSSFSSIMSTYSPPQTLTTNTLTFSISSSLYCPPQTLTTNTVTFSISSSLYCPPPDPHNKHTNIQYQFLSIFPSPTTSQQTQ
jgi:hypothetical protein